MSITDQDTDHVQENACGHEHDHLGLAKTLDVIGDKWTITLIHHLIQGTNRFGQLLRSMEGISPKTLSLRLRILEQEGLIRREVFPGAPLHIEYYLTERGRSLHKVFQVMDEWGGQLG